MPIQPFKEVADTDDPIDISGRTWNHLVSILRQLLTPAGIEPVQVNMDGARPVISVEPFNKPNFLLCQTQYNSGNDADIDGQYAATYSYNLIDAISNTVLAYNVPLASQRMFALTTAQATVGIVAILPSNLDFFGNFDNGSLPNPGASGSGGGGGGGSGSGGPSNGSLDAAGNTPNTIYYLIWCDEVYGQEPSCVPGDSGSGSGS